MLNEYELLDSGDGLKLERFGDVVLSRPCDQAFWQQRKPGLWKTAAASFERQSGWKPHCDALMPSSWIAAINGIAMKLKPTPAGHIGVFPETRKLWNSITETLKSAPGESLSVLNLFAYSGGATLAAARAACSVCHLDSSRSMVTRAKENAVLNQLEDAPIRWIVEDVNKFVDREIRRGRKYDAIMLDPPSFGHGIRGEQYKLEKDLADTLRKCRSLLSPEPLFILLTAHTQGITTAFLTQLMKDVLGDGTITCGEMELTGADDEVRPINGGIWVQSCWHR